MNDTARRAAQAFEDFDHAMDPILDEEQDRDAYAAISMALAIRLVSYATGAQMIDAAPIAQSLCRELVTIKRQLKAGQ